MKTSKKYALSFLIAGMVILTSTTAKAVMIPSSKHNIRQPVEVTVAMKNLKTMRLSWAKDAKVTYYKVVFRKKGKKKNFKKITTKKNHVTVKKLKKKTAYDVTITSVAKNEGKSIQRHWWYPLLQCIFATGQMCDKIK